jgi:hypothetical protein
MRIFACAVILASCGGAAAAAEVPIIPRPVSVTAGEGVFQIRANTALMVDSRCPEAGRLLAAQLPLRPSARAGRRDNGISIAVDPQLNVPSEEGYVLEATAKRVEIRGKGPAGAYYGAQSLLQLIEPGGARSGSAPSASSTERRSAHCLFRFPLRDTFDERAGLMWASFGEGSMAAARIEECGR